MPTTEPGAGSVPGRSRATAAAPVAVDAAGTFDAALGVFAIFVSIPRVESVYSRLVVESWEDYAVERTMQRHADGDPSSCIVVVMAVPDFVEACVRGLSRLLAEVGGRQVEPPAGLLEALRRDLL